MRVLLIMPTLATYQFVGDLCKELIDMGWEVHIASSAFSFRSDVQLDDAIQHHLISLPRGADPISHWRSSRHLRSLVGRISPDVIEVHFSAAMLTVAMARTADWPSVHVTIHGLRFPTQTGLRGFIEKSVELWAARRMSDVAVLSMDDYVALEKEGLKNISLQPGYGMGCDLSRYDRSSVSAETVDEIRNTLGISENDTVLIYIGRQTAFKGFDIAVRAYLAATRYCPSLLLLICGIKDGLHPSGLSESEERLMQKHPRIRLLGWIDNLEDYLAVSDLCVFPSSREGMPVNLMESLSMGVPVITSDSRGCRDVVSNGKTGIVLTDMNSQNLEKAIVDLLNDHDLLSSYSETALKERDKFDRQVYVDTRRSYLQSVLVREHRNAA